MLIHMIAIINPNKIFLKVPFILPFCLPLKINTNISNMSNIIGVGTVSPLFLHPLKHSIEQ